MTDSTVMGPLSATYGLTAGYDMVGSDGGVFVFSPPGTTGRFFGSLPGLEVSVHNIVGMVPTSTDRGYFLVGSDGGVFAFGNAPFLGSLPGLGVTPGQPITGLVPTGTDGGYFLVGRDGGVFAFGNASFLGSLPGIGVHRDDIIGIAATPSGSGYWLVAADGTVYGFGAVQTLGSATGTSSPVTAIAGTPDGGGYWIVTKNGSVHDFGDAKSFSTLPALGVAPAHPVIGIVPTADTGGYWLVGADGGIFAFGDAGFVGSLPGLTVHVTDVVGAVPTTPAPAPAPTTTTTRTAPPPPTTTTTTAPPPATPPAGGNCTDPIYNTTNPEGTINTDPDPPSPEYWWVNNDAWNGSHGPQTIFVCSQSSWYAVSNQPNTAGAVETFPDTEYDVGGRETGTTTPITGFTTITSTFSEAYPSAGGWDAAYDLWLTNWSTEIMIWNQWAGTQSYWPEQATTAVTLGGVGYKFYNNGGELMFFRDTEATSGSVNILDAFKWLVAKGFVQATAVPTQLEYGVEVCYTTGTETFPMTGLTFSLTK